MSGKCTWPDITQYHSARRADAQPLARVPEIGHRGEFALRFAQLREHFDLSQALSFLVFVPD